MAKPHDQYARIHLLPAKEAPYVVVIRRKPSKKVHIMRWNTQTDEIEHGSWFDGRIYELSCDVSFDGKWLFYHADHQTGICDSTHIDSGVSWECYWSRSQAGYFAAADMLVLDAGIHWEDVDNAISEANRHIPFHVRPPSGGLHKGEDGVYIERLIRDGYTQRPKTTVAATSDYGPTARLYSADECLADNWAIKPTPDHPVLRVTYLGHFVNRGKVYRVDLPEYPALLNFQVTSAAYDCLGQLVVARRGALERYTLNDIPLGKVSFRLDLEGLVAPDRE